MHFLNYIPSASRYLPGYFYSLLITLIVFPSSMPQLCIIKPNLVGLGVAINPSKCKSLFFNNNVYKIKEEVASGVEGANVG